MRKLINDPYDCVDEMVAGVRAAHAGQVSVTPGGRGVVLRDLDQRRRVRIVTGGGSGHEPAFFGYLGQGLADAAAVGNVFASPSAQPVVEVAEAMAPIEALVAIYGNYDGDVMNFDMASEILLDRGIPVRTVLVTDEISSADRLSRGDRRGAAGGTLVLKAAGARADEGGDLEAVVTAAQHANANTRTIGVGLSSCVLPTSGVPTFDLPDGQMEIGMGIHGESGLVRRGLATANEVADELLQAIAADGGLGGLPVAVLVNTFGATTLMEAYIVAGRVAAQLDKNGIEVRRMLLGEYVTSLEMAGLSLTVTDLDAELDRLLAAPARALCGRSFGVPGC